MPRNHESSRIRTSLNHIITGSSRHTSPTGMRSQFPRQVVLEDGCAFRCCELTGLPLSGAIEHMDGCGCVRGRNAERVYMAEYLVLWRDLAVEHRLGTESYLDWVRWYAGELLFGVGYWEQMKHGQEEERMVEQ
ncbi:hypothetical protein SUNI508_09874 [Seiridium unicorne]|uniref:Uncharacterized protein n=1 Tax=Seiridium unicorne TaxID=138068 RepID=A0ABR2UNF6_9PEZI